MIRFKDTKKFLYCPKCKRYPDMIIEKYLKPIKELRKWNGEVYELFESNIELVEFEQLCSVCKTKLIEK